MTPRPPGRTADRLVSISVGEGAGGGADRAATLTRALQASDFFDTLDHTWRRDGRPADEFPIVLQVELIGLDPGASTGTDPYVVEWLVDRLGEAGFTHVCVTDGRDSADRWLENRSVLGTADLLGYRFQTPEGRDYEVVDLTDELVEVPLPPGSVLQGTPLPRRWMEAGFRVLVTRAKTSTVHRVSGGVANLLRLLPARDKDHHLGVRLDPGEVALALWQAAPAHFSVVDAWVGSHGQAGDRVYRPITTGTVLAGPDARLVDLALATKMGVDPYTCPALGHLLRETNAPAPLFVGPLGRWSGWENVNPALAEAARLALRLPGVSRLAFASAAVDDRSFPFRSEVDRRLNQVLAPLLARADDNPAALAAVTALYSLAASVDRGLDTWGVLVDKDRLRWREVSLGFDPATVPDGDWAEVLPYLDALGQLLADRPADEEGLRWCYLDGSVLFVAEGRLGIPFAEFVARVEVAESVQLMNDYIGGQSVVLERDSDGRPIRQATRTIYLPQPNFLALSGGEPIDVCKIEVAVHGPDEHRVGWRTVSSPNGSALLDDGLVRFLPDPAGTRVVILARQKFKLPPLWEAAGIDRLPAVKDPIVTWSYHRYFRHTLTNFEARFEGRPHRIGLASDPTVGEGDSPDPAALALRQARDRLGGINLPAFPALGEVVQRIAGTARPAPTEVDEDGFSHFAPAPVEAAVEPGRTRLRFGDSQAWSATPLRVAAGEVTTMVRDLGEALLRDLAGISGSGIGGAGRTTVDDRSGDHR